MAANNANYLFSGTPSTNRGRASTNPCVPNRNVAFLQQVVVVHDLCKTSYIYIYKFDSKSERERERTERREDDTHSCVWIYLQSAHSLPCCGVCVCVVPRESARIPVWLMRGGRQMLCVACCEGVCACMLVWWSWCWCWHRVSARQEMRYKSNTLNMYMHKRFRRICYWVYVCTQAAGQEVRDVFHFTCSWMPSGYIA